MVDIREYHDAGGRSIFREWFNRLNAEAARKVTTAVYRASLGNFSNASGVGAGAYELKINFGPGYRVYFGKDGSGSSSFLGAERNNVSRMISSWHSATGMTINGERTRKDRSEHGIGTRFPGNSTSAREA
jgi:putative addiction module killer protein